MNFRDIWAIARKDLIACIKDKVILVQVLVLPFIIVFGYASLMTAMNGSDNAGDMKAENAYYVNAPAEIESQLTKIGYQKAGEGETEKIKHQIKDKKANLLIVFPQDFKMKMENGADLDNVEIWYNSDKRSSLTQYSMVSELLNTFQPKVFTVNADTNVTYNFGDPNSALKNFLGMILPLMVLMSVFMVCMNLAAQAITGEKERGFMNTLLITPVKRSSLALGKALCIFITAIVGGLSAFTGMAVSLPQLGKTFGAEEGFSFSFGDYFQLFAVTITAVFVLVGILLIVSTLAKDIKQATTISPIFMMVLMIAGMLTMSDNIRDAVEGIGTVNYLIPAWNTMRVMQEIIAAKYDAVNVAITCGVNLVVTVLMIAVISRLFDREAMLKD